MVDVARCSDAVDALVAANTFRGKGRLCVANNTYLTGGLCDLQRLELCELHTASTASLAQWVLTESGLSRVAQGAKLSNPTRIIEVNPRTPALEDWNSVALAVKLLQDGWQCSLPPRRGQS